MYRRIIVSYSSINKYFSCQSNYFTNYETMQEPNHMPGNRAPLFWEMLHKLKYLSCFGMSREKLQQLWKSHCFLLNRLHSGLFLSQKRGKNLKKKQIWSQIHLRDFFFGIYFLKGSTFQDQNKPLWKYIVYSYSFFENFTSGLRKIMFCFG